MMTGDTIAAISSAVGPAARMIVRMSGPDATSIIRKIVFDADVSSVSQAKLRIGRISVPATVYAFHSPRSVTGEDVGELHIPGNPLLARMVLEELIQLGARQAEAGEFTARAYFNGGIDLTEAEGVAATISAHSERELSAARQLLAGELARRLRPILDSLAETLALIEVGIDFTDEDVTFLSRAEIATRITSASQSLQELLSSSMRFERLTHEPRIVLAGRPNAGKSTLLNRLSGGERAVVSPTAGTTRDAIWAHVNLPRGMVRLIDVAGIEKVDADDDISRQMRAHAEQTIEEADFVVLLRDVSDPLPPLELFRRPDMTIKTKCDLPEASQQADVSISAKTGENIDLLKQRLDDLVFGHESQAEQTLALNARHIAEIESAIENLHRAGEASALAGHELIALDLREALEAIGRILGSITPDDLLGRVFSLFCIGK